MVKGPAASVEVVNDIEPEDVCLQATGGLSDEDDTLEQEAAISNPLKGTDTCGKAKVSSQLSTS